MRLRRLFERYYASSGFRVEDGGDGTVLGHGFGGVTWIGLPVVATDVDAPGFVDHLRELSERRMPTGERCPLEILAEEGCRSVVESVLRQLGLFDRGHVELYSINA